MERIHGHLRPRTYVEIGVQKGRSFMLAGPGTKAVGIDPAPRLGSNSDGARVFPLASDEFFREHDLRDVLSGSSVDLAFIDGMHLFEFALRDFINLERYCTRESVVLVHDCNPPAAFMATRERQTAVWSGDVWKLVVALREARPDLGVSVVDVSPSGLGVVTGLDPASTVLSDRYQQLHDELIGLEYAWLDPGRDQKLNLVGGDWETVRGLLPAPYQGA
jgi:hypothetical protein